MVLNEGKRIQVNEAILLRDLQKFYLHIQSLPELNLNPISQPLLQQPCMLWSIQPE